MTMTPGQILVANYKGTYVIKMQGDVRLTFCVSFDQFIETMFSDSRFTSVVFDLAAADAVDSTTLGLMAKIAILCQERRGVKPVLIATNSGIQRLLGTMGFEDIFVIVDKLDAPELAKHSALLCNACDEKVIKAKVLEAHKILMSMNAQNEETFRDLVNMLQGG